MIEGQHQRHRHTRRIDTLRDLCDRLGLPKAMNPARRIEHRGMGLEAIAALVRVRGM